MNQTVNKNRTAIVHAGANISKELSALISLATENHKAYLDLTEKGVYSSDYLRQRVDEINAEFHSKSAAHAPAILAEIDKIEAAGVELENALDVTDAELSSAIHIIEASGGAVDTSTQDLILNTLKGNQKALRVLKGIYTRYGAPTRALDEFIFEIAQEVDFMRDRVEGATSEPYANFGNIQDIRGKLIQICKLIGAEYSPEDFELGSYYEEMQNMSLRKAMGLGV